MKRSVDSPLPILKSLAVATFIRRLYECGFYKAEIALPTSLVYPLTSKQNLSVGIPHLAVKVCMD